MSVLAPMRILAAAFSAALAALTLDACASQPCPLISLASVVTVHVTPQRAATLDPASLMGEACQDGTCSGGPLTLRADDGLTANPTPSPVPYTAMIPLKKGLTESPIDLTITGKDVSGASIGDPSLRFNPKGTYPWGPQCSRVVVAEATLDNLGLHAG